MIHYLLCLCHWQQSFHFHFQSLQTGGWEQQFLKEEHSHIPPSGLSSAHCQTVHYCCLMSSKSVNILHVLSLTTLILFHHLPTFLSTVHFLWLFHKLRVVCAFWQQRLAWFVWSTVKGYHYLNQRDQVHFFFCATSSKCWSVRWQQTVINKLFIFK